MLGVRVRAASLAAAIAIVAAAAAVLLLWPSVRRVQAESRRQQARQDVETITHALLRFYKDNGFFPLWDRAPAGTGSFLRRIDVLAGPGDPPAARAGSEWLNGITGSFEDQLVSNAPSYRVRGGPDEQGWNGPYLPAEVAADPWSHHYAVNIGLIPTDDPADPDATKYAVWVLSAGPNGVIDTPYRQPLASAALAGDDIGSRVQ